MKEKLQKLLKRVGWYGRIKSSCFYDLYWTFANPRLLRERANEVDFYRNTLSGIKRGSLVYDVGANHGQKTDVFLRCGAIVIAVDPDKANQDILRERFLSWRLRQKPVTIVNMAVSDEQTTRTMWIDGPGSAFNTLNPKWVDSLRTDPGRHGGALQFRETQTVKTTTLEDLFRLYGRPFYIKIDVEGHECAVLRGLHTVVPYLSFEVNLPEFKNEAIASVEMLMQLDPAGEFMLTADCRNDHELKVWCVGSEFHAILDACHESCIEVFWRSGSSDPSVFGRASNTQSIQSGTIKLHA